jgi:Mg2+ and Co2+ transporter CorA
MAPGDRDLINVRDRIGEAERAIELLHGDVKNGLEFTVAYQAERQADRAHSMAVSAHRLNLLVAAFFPVATVAAVFGMNLAHGLDGWNKPIYFWGLLVAGLVAGLVLAGLIARRPPAHIPAVPPSKAVMKRRPG